MANRDNRNKHNRGGYKSIGSQVGGALGGHLSSQGKLGGGAKKGGNFSFDKFGKFVGNFFTKPGYAQTMGDLTGNVSQLKEPSAWKIKQFADKNIDITKMNKSFRVDIDTQRAINKIENEKVRNWLNKYAPQSVKDLKINHQMYSPTKVMPGDKGYKPTGTGSIKLDPDTEKYLEWMARANPQGNTISDYEKRYAKSIAAGYGLKEAMRHNPAETGSYYALIDDEPTQTTADLLKSGMTTADLLSSNNNSTTNNTMALNQAQVNKLYNEMLGRNATFGDASEYDADYWVGKTADQVKSGISGSSEFLNRKALVDAAGAGGISEADLDKQVMAGGWKTEHHSDYANSGQDLFDFNRDNNWISSTGGGNAWAKEQNAINQVLGATAANNYSTEVGTGSGGGVTDGSTIPVDTDTGTDTGTGGWWTEFADKDAFKDFLTGGQQKSDGMGDFMKFMMLMSVMGGGRGGGMMGGGSQYGYGGLNPGGVQAAYNPWEGMQTGMKFFKDNFGSGVDGGTTVNATGS